MTVSQSPAEGRDDILDVLSKCLTPEVAQRILAIRIPPDVQSRVEQWSARSARGELTNSERLSYEELVEKADLLGIFKSIARQSLASPRG